MKKKFLAGLAVGLFMGAIGGVAQATTYNPTTEFSIAGSNPNGVWTYGWTPSSNFSDFHSFTSTVNTVFLAWYTPGMSSDYTATVAYNASPDMHYGVAPGQLTLHPGPAYQAAVLRFTAQTDGMYSAAGQFLPGDRGTMQVGIRQGGEFIWTATNAGEFSLLDRTMRTGDTLDFLVYGGYGYGNTPLSLSVSANTHTSSTPIPGAVWLMGSGLAGLVGLRRKQQGA